FPFESREDLPLRDELSLMPYYSVEYWPELVGEEGLRSSENSRCENVVSPLDLTRDAGYLLALYLEGPPVQPAAETLRRRSPGLAHHSADEAWKLVASKRRNKSPVMNEVHNFRLSFQTEARFEPMLSLPNLFCFLD